MLANPLAPQVASGMILLYPELPVALWVMREPPLADEELEHRAQRPDRLKE